MIGRKLSGAMRPLLMPLCCIALAGFVPGAKGEDWDDWRGIWKGVEPVADDEEFDELDTPPPVLASLFPQVHRSPSWIRVTQAAGRTQWLLQEELLSKGLVFGDPVFLRIFKEERLLEVWVRSRDSGKYELFRVWPIAACGEAPGPKLSEGDGQSPEGFYSVPRARLQPNTHNHLAFNIGYPNAYDRLHGRTGSAILVHGNDVSVGCFAMTNARIEEIYTLCAAALNNGQRFFRVHVFPFRMTPERMTAAIGQPWEEFWSNLKEGYDFFEIEKIPPDVTVENFRYAFKEGGQIAPPPRVASGR